MSKRNVLVVDDEPIILKAIDRVLGNDDIKVFCCNDYATAMEVIFHHNIELVITDIMLENHDPLFSRNGIALMQEIKEYLSIPVFVISANADYLIEAKYSGADETLEKPINNQELSVLVNYYLKKHTTRVKA